jgi:hypothetical protein
MGLGGAQGCYDPAKNRSIKSLAPEVRGRHMEALIVELEENPAGQVSIHEGEE